MVVKVRIMMINNNYSNVPLIIKEVDILLLSRRLPTKIITAVCEIENANIPPLSILYVESEHYKDDTIYVKFLNKIHSV